MRTLKKFPAFAGLFLLPVVAFSQTTLNYTIAKWYDNKKAASSITFDDAISGQFTEAMPIMDAKNIKGTFFLTSRNLVSQLGGWSTVLKAARGGHEIANHSVTHTSLGNLSEADINNELKGCNDAIFANTKVKSITMAYPNGSGGDNTADDQKVRDVAKKYFIGARAVGGDFNEYNFFDVEENYFKVRSPMISDGTSALSFASMINSTINTGGWFCPTYHGVVNGWIIVPKALFEAHMNELVKKRDDLWISTFANVLRYHRQRKSAKLTKVSEDAQSWVLSLSDTLSNNLLWNQALTLNVDAPSWPIYGVTQNGQSIPYSTMGRQIMFNAVPDAGNISISKVLVLETMDATPLKGTWSVIPNPAADHVNIINLIENKEYQISISLINGEILKKLQLTAKDNQILIPSQYLKKGTNVITIDGTSQKVIIQ